MGFSLQYEDGLKLGVKMRLHVDHFLGSQREAALHRVYIRRGAWCHQIVDLSKPTSMRNKLSILLTQTRREMVVSTIQATDWIGLAHQPENPKKTRSRSRRQIATISVSSSHEHVHGMTGLSIA